MSDSYIGWDGNSYPWPPPDGWHEASDGRWWAPGTGPGPAPQAAAPPPAAPTPDPGTPSFSPGDLSAQQTAPIPSAFEQAGGYPPPDVGQGAPPPDPSLGATAPFSPGDMPDGPNVASPHTVPSAGMPLPPPGQGNAPPPAAKGGGRSILFIGLGVLLLLGLLGGGYFLLSSDGDETASDTTAPLGADSDSTVSTIPTDPATSESTTADTDGEATDDTTDDSTSTTVADGSATSAPGETGSTTSLVIDSDQIARFRELLTNNSLTGDALTDEDVESFGASFCSFAALSPSSTVFDEFRSQAIRETANSELDADELSLVIDAALVSFCPEEAQRLGIGL